MARTTTTKLSARDRARAAKAKLDAAGRDHHKLVEDAVTGFYEADDAREAALAAIAAADAARGAAITTLSGLNESVTRIASLTCLDPSEVRKLKRTTPSPDADQGANVAVDPGASAS